MNLSAVAMRNATSCGGETETSPPSYSPTPGSDRNVAQSAQWLSFLSAEMVQAKLEVGDPDDPLEREADAAADRVMQLAAPSPGLSHTTETVRRKCATCGDEEEPVRLKPANLSSPAGAAPSTVERAIGSAGGSLDAGTREFMEHGFGADFSRVRIHTDAQAAQSARDIGALAYTVGSDIVFADGQFDPTGQTGRRLLAHELAHVVQQGSGSKVVQRLPDPNCGSATALPVRSTCPAPGDPRSGFHNTCYSNSFTASAGTTVSISAIVSDAEDCDSGGDFRTELWQCHTLIDEKIRDFGTVMLGRTMTGTATIPGAGTFSSDKFYIRVYTRSSCPVTASISVS